MANHTQQVKNKPLSSLAGILVIVGLLAFLYCLSVILNAFQSRFGMSYDAAVVSLWLIGGAIALLFMHDRVLKYTYTLEGSTLKLDRYYGRYMRHARDIMFRRIEEIGDPEAMKAKYPGSHHEKYVRRQCEIAPLAIVHISDNKRYISVIQPDDVLRSALENRPNKRK